MRRWIATTAALVVLTAGCQDAPGTDGAASEASSTLPDTLAPTATTASELHMPFRLTEQQQAGRLVWENVCWTCHGMAGRGDGILTRNDTFPRPPSFHGGLVATMDVEQLEALLREQMPTGEAARPHMHLVDSLMAPERLEAALAYIPALLYPEEIPGSAMAGRQIYDDYCVGCHGPGGRGDGEAAHLMSVTPASFPTDTLLERRDFDGVFERIKRGAGRVHGSSMPPWGAMLGDDEIWDLVAYVATFHPSSLSEPPTSER